MNFTTSKGNCLLQLFRGNGMRVYVDGQIAAEFGDDVVTSAATGRATAAEVLLVAVEGAVGLTNERDVVLHGLSLWLAKNYSQKPENDEG